MAVIEVVMKVTCLLLKVKLKVKGKYSQGLHWLCISYSRPGLLNNSIFMVKSAHSCRITHIQHFLHVNVSLLNTNIEETYRSLKLNQITFTLKQTLAGKHSVRQMLENNEENDKVCHISIMIYIVPHMHTARATAKGHKMPILNYIMNV